MILLLGVREPSLHESPSLPDSMPCPPNNGRATCGRLWARLGSEGWRGLKSRRCDVSGEMWRDARRAPVGSSRGSESAHFRPVMLPLPPREAQRVELPYRLECGQPGSTDGVLGCFKRIE